MRTITDFPRNEAGLVDKFIGTAYDTVKFVADNMEQIKFIFDFMSKYNVLICLDDATALPALDTRVAKFARVYDTDAVIKRYDDYIYMPNDTSGILPVTGTGSWVLVAGSGGGSGAGESVPWLYNDGQANGGEETIHIDFPTAGVPEIYINGVRQTLGLGYTFNILTNSITVAEALTQGDELVAKLWGLPALPGIPTIDDYKYANWLYNNGAAIGGEVTLNPPYIFAHVPAVFKNGLRLVEGIGYTADATNFTITMAVPLVTGDTVVAQLGGELDTTDIVDSTLQQVARAVNLPDQAVILSSNRTESLFAKSVVYDVVAQKSWQLPFGIPAGAKIEGLLGDQLSYSPGSVVVTLLPIMKKDSEVSTQQPYTSAIVRNQRDKNKERVSVLDFGAKPDNSAYSTDAFIAAATAVGEGGTVYVPAGNYLIKTVSCLPVNFLGDGQGATVINFDNTVTASGFVFSQPTKRNVEAGARHLTVKTVNGNGNYCFDTTGSVGVNQKYPKYTFKNLSFCSEDTGDVTENFSQTFGWKFIFHLGDSWQLIVDAIDAVGCYKTTVDPTAQFLDGFIRFNAAQGILSSRISNITTHNVANCIEIRQKTYFSLHNIDFAKAYQGVYDAPDRVFETNVYAYGESIWTNVIINAQKVGVKLKNRFDFFCEGLIIHKGTAFDNGAEWVGLDLEKARVTRIHGLEIGAQSGYTGKKIGVRLDGGDDNAFTGVSLGTLDVGMQFGVAGSANGASQAVQVTSTAINAAVTTIFDIQVVRNLIIDGFVNSSLYAYTNLALFGVDTANTYTFSNIAHAHLWTDDSIYWRNGAAAADTKSTRIALLTGLTITSQTDAGGIGNNMFIGRRTGTIWDSVELRTKATTGGLIQLTAPEVQFSGFGKPTVDNTVAWGTAAFRWTTGYFASGTATTSDRTMKTDEQWLSDAEKAVALTCKSLLKRYKYKDAVAKKGDSARYHFGAIAQDVEQAFKDGGLNPDDYGVIIWEEWGETPEQIEPAVYEDGVLVKEEYVTIPYRAAGGAYSLRYEELAMFILASI